MAVPMKPSSTEYGMYFPPGSEDLYEHVGLKARFPHFSFAELCCKGTGSLRVHYDTLDKLEGLRRLYGGPIPINSYYRSEEYNRQVGGAEHSLHLAGRAIDTPILNGNVEGRAKLVFLATKAGFSGFGFYPRFNHIDTGRARTWSEGMAATPMFPVPKPLFDDEGNVIRENI